MPRKRGSTLIRNNLIKTINGQNSLPQDLYQINSPDIFLHNEVKDLLPKTIQDALDIIVTDEGKDTMLFARIILDSRLTAGIRFLHRGKEFSCNLHGYMIAGSGIGKDEVGHALSLYDPIKKDFFEYEKRYNQERKRIEDVNRSLNKNDTPADVPPKKVFRFQSAGDSNLPTLNKILSDNHGLGLIFETEASVVAKARAGEHGYNTLLLKSFDNGFYLKDNLGTLLEGTWSDPIDRVAMSVFISSTPQDIKDVIPKENDGLHSRFFYNTVKPNYKYDSGENIPNYFEALTPVRYNILKMWNEVFSHWSGPGIDVTSIEIISIISKNELDLHTEYCTTMKDDLLNEVHEDLNGVSNRIAVMIKRIAVIFSIEKLVEQGRAAASIKEFYVDKDSMRAAIIIVDYYLDISIQVFDIIRGTNEGKAIPKAQDNASSTYLEKLEIYKSNRVEFETDKDFVNNNIDVFISQGNFRKWKSTAKKAGDID